MKLSKNNILFLFFFMPLMLSAQIQLPRWYEGDDVTIGFNLNSIGQDVELAYTHRLGSNAALRLGVHLLTSTDALTGGYVDFDVARFKNRVGWDLSFQVLKPNKHKNVEIGPFFRVQYFRLTKIEEVFIFTPTGGAVVERNNLSRTFDGIVGIITKLKLDEKSPLFLELAAGIGLLTFQDNFNFRGPFGVGVANPDDQDFSTDFGSLFHVGLAYRL